MTYSRIDRRFSRVLHHRKCSAQRHTPITMISATTKLLIPLALGCVVSLSVLVFSERSHHRLNQANQLISSSIETQAVASQLLALVTDAETAQRGFILDQSAAVSRALHGSAATGRSQTAPAEGADCRQPGATRARRAACQTGRREVHRAGGCAHVVQEARPAGCAGADRDRRRPPHDGWDPQAGGGDPRERACAADRALRALERRRGLFAFRDDGHNGPQL